MLPETKNINTLDYQPPDLYLVPYCGRCVFVRFSLPAWRRRHQGVPVKIIGPYVLILSVPWIGISRLAVRAPVSHSQYIQLSVCALSEVDASRVGPLFGELTSHHRRGRDYSRRRTIGSKVNASARRRECARIISIHIALFLVFKNESKD